MLTLDRGPLERQTNMTEAFAHEPVLLAEVLDVFAPVVGGTIIDATLGGGGHSNALLTQDPTRSVIGIDRDDAALQAASQRLAPFGNRFSVRKGTFADVLADLAAAGAMDMRVAGVLFDLGVSSPQLDHAERGFSYNTEAPLDMRMDRGAVLDAATVVNTYTAAELSRILHVYGDERFAGRIAAAIVSARPILTTTALAAVVRDAIPAATRRTGGHPAKRTFQAVRIEVNGELAGLRAAFASAERIVQPGGRIAVLSYHSGEDRIVKAFMRDAQDGGCTCPVGLPCVCGATPTGRILTRGGITASENELRFNPRSASARLRAMEVIA